jgi:nucleoside recognition membrane protein YjiH
MKNLVV